MKIGFKNFKKFKDFPMIELAPITFLVGPNNSGKSSFIKASLLLIYNLIKKHDSIEKFGLETPLIDSFSFFNNTTTNYGWGDYFSSLNHNIRGENIIFKFTCAGHEFELEYGMFSPMNGIIQNPNLWSVKVKSIDNHKGLNVAYHWPWNEISCDYVINANFLRHWAEDRYNILNDRYLRQGYGVMWPYIPGEEIVNIQTDFEIEHKELGRLLRKINQCNSNEILTDKIEDEDIKKGVKDCVSFCLNELKQDLKNELFRDLIYVETHNVSHRCTLDTCDKNNYVAQTVFEYMSKSSLPSVDTGHRFATKWLKEFGIGERFLIREEYYGEILSVDIIHDKERYYSDSKDKTGSFTNLGHMGTGSIQIFVMLLKLAIAIEESKKMGRILLEIEEPEQNSHPAFQSKLADVFKDVYDLSEGRVSLIVETHSEYMIRRSQVIVAQQNYTNDTDLAEKNPFKVYYFPEDGMPYDMGFQVNGKFIESFGTGFFDVADNAAVALYELDEN